MGVFRFRDRWQQSIRDIWNREDQTDRLMVLLEQRDRDLENFVSGREDTYVPTWTNTTVGNGSVTGGFWVQGGWCTFWTIFALGSTSAVSSGGHSVPLPVTAAAAEQGTFQFTMKDSGNFYWPGLAITSDTSNVYLYLLDASGGYSRGNNFSATAPFTFGADDKLIVSGVYPVAAKS